MIKIKGYTENDIIYIKENFATMTNKDIAKNLDKKPESIKYVANKLGLIKQPHKFWNIEEDNFLKEHYIDMGSEEIAKILNRTVASINARRDDLHLVKHESWSEDELSFLKNNYLDMTHLEIGEKLGRSEGAVRAKCFDLDLYKKDLPWEQWELDFVKENYMEMATKEISEILGRSPNAVKLKAERIGMKKYPYYCDYHFFDEIDTEEKAYWLGFITADGWINKNERTNSGAIGIELQYGDIGHLRKFNKAINGNYQITDRWRTCTLPKASDKLHHMCCIRIFSIIMYNALEKLGFSKDKSYTVAIPNIRKDLIRHYFRGYFDGDGCFCLSNKSFIISFITASERYSKDIINSLSNIGIIISDYTYINEYGTTMHRPEIYKKDDKIKFLDWIYKDSNIYLDRKYKKYLKAKEKYDSLNGLASQE